MKIAKLMYEDTFLHHMKWYVYVPLSKLKISTVNGQQIDNLSLLQIFTPIKTDCRLENKGKG